MTYQFTVLLLRPDYIADNYGQDTFMSHVEVSEDSVDEAIKAAQEEVLIVDYGTDADEDDLIGVSPEDYHPLLVCRGHIENFV